MRILVYPHDLHIGGSQLNAIEIAGAVRDLGHDVVVYGQPGPLVDRIHQLDLEFLASPQPRRRPSPAIVRDLARLVEEREIDILHGYEWPPALECRIAARLRGATSVATVMSMAVAPFIPHAMPLVVGTRQIAGHARHTGYQKVEVLEPPVDTAANHPAFSDGVADFKSKWCLSNDGLILVTVTRLAHEMKLEGLLQAMDALATMPSSVELTMVVVGDGPAREDVQDRAAAVNNSLGRRAVVVTGEIADPRPAYAAADITFGMGGSALRSLAFGKPLLVQGESGFWRLLSAETVNEFLWTGWYGVGRGSSEGSSEFAAELKPLLQDSGLRTELGTFGQRLIEEQFSLDRAGALQIDIYERALTQIHQPVRNRLDEAKSAVTLSTYLVRRKISKVMGLAARDDFNSRPVAALHPSEAQS